MYWDFLCVRHSTYITSNPHNNPLRKIVFAFLFPPPVLYKWGQWRPREVKQLPQDHTANKWPGSELGSSNCSISCCLSGAGSSLGMACPQIPAQEEGSSLFPALAWGPEHAPALALASGSVCSEQRLWFFSTATALQLQDQWTTILTRRLYQALALFRAQWETQSWSWSGNLGFYSCHQLWWTRMDNPSTITIRYDLAWLWNAGLSVLIAFCSSWC